jgi:hypothetical protein
LGVASFRGCNSLSFPNSNSLIAKNATTELWNFIMSICSKCKNYNPKDEKYFCKMEIGKITVWNWKKKNFKEFTENINECELFELVSKT